MGKHTTIYIPFFLGIFFAVGVPFAYADTIGQQELFSIDSQYDSKGRAQVNATLHAVSQKAYFYVADDYWNALDATGRTNLENLMIGMGNEFDTKIYPLETGFFGLDPIPGIDGDPRITMLLTALRSNVGGYFDSAHGYSKTTVPYSNQREMLYLNTSQFSDTARMYPFVAHEFQHLISFNQKELLRNVSDDIWLNELRSEYAPTLVGYNQVYQGSNLQRRVNSFFQYPSDSLTDWPNDLADYGQVGTLGEYIAERWSSRIIADTLPTTAAGARSLDEALMKNGYSQSFDDLFASWMLANLLNNTSLSPFYGYSRPELASLRVEPTQRILGLNDTTVLSFPFSTKGWEQRWYDIQALAPSEKPILKITANTFSGISNVRIPYLAFRADGTTEYRMLSGISGSGEFTIPDIGTSVTRIILMPYLRVSGALDISVQRVDEKSLFVSPEQFGLHEGDFIRAEGDKDIYIINQFGYKRIVLSPQICLQYGHLGARGCFSAVKMVTPAIRDAFKTSPFYSNGETKDGKVYQLIETGEDSAYLQLVTHVLDNTVFFMNTREQRAYSQ
ncbi:MAG: hypothetical protein AAB420_00725 [Patescibacteria group bacterium]